MCVDLAGATADLLVALRALSRGRTATRGASVVESSQPAMGDALGRLRRQSGDDLLVRDGRGLALTPMTRELQHAVEPALGMVERALRIQASSDPATAVQHSRIVTSDDGTSPVAQRFRGPRRLARGSPWTGCRSTTGSSGTARRR